MALRYWREAFLKELRESGVLRDAAAAVRIYPSTVWKARSKDASFDREVIEAIKSHYMDRTQAC